MDEEWKEIKKATLEEMRKRFGSIDAETLESLEQMWEKQQQESYRICVELRCFEDE